MTEVGEVIRLYGAAWLEPGDARRAELLQRAWADDGVYTDPTARVEGRDALVAHIAGFAERLPGHRIVLTTGVDAHGPHVRFGWRMLGPDGAAVLDGMDYGELGPDGRLVRIVGFFGPFPAPAGEG